MLPSNPRKTLLILGVVILSLVAITGWIAYLGRVSINQQSSTQQLTLSPSPEATTLRVNQNAALDFTNSVVYISNNNDVYELNLLNISTGAKQLVQQFKTPPDEWQALSYITDKTRLIFTNPDDHNLYLLKAAEPAYPIKITTEGSTMTSEFWGIKFSNVKWSRDSSKVFYKMFSEIFGVGGPVKQKTKPAKYGLYIIDKEGKLIKYLGELSSKVINWGFNPEKNELITSGQDDREKLMRTYLWNYETNEKQLIFPDKEITAVSYSEIGDKVAYGARSYDGTTKSVYVGFTPYYAFASPPKFIGSDKFVKLSPDGKRLLIHRTIGSEYESGWGVIALWDDDLAKTTVLLESYEIHDLFWLKNGQKVLYKEKDDLYTIDVITKQKQRLTTNENIILFSY